MKPKPRSELFLVRLFLHLKAEKCFTIFKLFKNNNVFKGLKMVHLYKSTFLSSTRFQEKIIDDT